MYILLFYYFVIAICNGALRRRDISRTAEIIQLIHNFMDIKMNVKERENRVWKIIHACIICRNYLFRRDVTLYITYTRDLRKIKKRKKNLSPAL